MRTAKDVVRDTLYYTLGVDQVQRLMHLSQYLNSQSGHQAALAHNSRDNSCYLLGTANYPNLGDLALVEAEVRLLHRFYDNIIEVPSFRFWEFARSIKQTLCPGDRIYLHAGGNMTDMYSSLDFERMAEVAFLPQGKFILFPQTISYSATNNGQKELRYSQKVYATADITFFAREHASYEQFRRLYPEHRSFLVPDIVLSMGEDPLFSQTPSQDDSVLLCLRHDCERITAAVSMSSLTEFFSSQHLSARPIDTVIKHSGSVFPSERRPLLEQLLHKFKQARLIVTDRLHGLVFATLCGTPCIALPNSNGKVKNLYKQWLQGIDYVRFIDEPTTEKIKTVAKELLESGHGSFPAYHYEELFTPLINEIVPSQ